MLAVLSPRGSFSTPSRQAIGDYYYYCRVGFFVLEDSFGGLFFLCVGSVSSRVSDLQKMCLLPTVA